MPVFSGNIGDLISRSQKEKLAESRLWDLTRNYLSGRQWLVFDTVSNNYVRYNDGQNHARVVVNVMAPLYRTLVSLLATRYPGIRVLPASPSIEDVTQAQSSGVAVEYYWQQDNLQASFSKLVKWLCATGNAGRRTYYHSGDKRVRTDIVSPYDIFPEPSNTNVDDVAWWAVRTLTQRKDLLESYKHAAPGLVGSVKDRVDAIENAQAFLDADAKGNDQDSKVPDDRVEVFEIYWKDGRHAVWLGKTGPYLYTGETPKGARPFSLVRYTDMPGRLWGQSPFAAVIDLQNMYNQGRAIVFESARLMANPIWLNPTTSQVRAGTLSNKPGKVVDFNPIGGAPQRVPGVGLPPDFYGALDRIQAEILDIVGIHNTTLGKAPVTLKSGRAIEATTALDVGQLQMTQANIEEAAKDTATTALILMKAHYVEGQFVRMLDQTGRVSSQQIKQTDYVDNPEVFIEANSLFRQESEDKDAQTLQLYEMELIDADEARQRLSHKLGDFKALQKMRAFAHAQKILAAAAGAFGPTKGVDILPTDDLDAIKQTFDEFMQTQEFEQLPPDRQDYVTSILKAVAQAQQGKQLDPNQLAEAAYGKVWPPQPRNDKQAAELQVAAASPLIQAQVENERRVMAEKAVQMQAAAGQAPPQGVPGGPVDGGLG